MNLMSAEPFILWSLRASDRHCLHPVAMARRTIALLAMAVAVVSGQEVPNAPATPQESPAAPVPAAPVPAAPVPAAPVPAAPVTPIVEPPEELTRGTFIRPVGFGDMLMRLCSEELFFRRVSIRA